MNTVPVKPVDATGRNLAKALLRMLGFRRPKRDAQLSTTGATGLDALRHVYNRWFTHVPDVSFKLVSTGLNWFQLVPTYWFHLGFKLLVSDWFQIGFNSLVSTHRCQPHQIIVQQRGSPPPSFGCARQHGGSSGWRQTARAYRPEPQLFETRKKHTSPTPRFNREYASQS